MEDFVGANIYCPYVFADGNWQSWIINCCIGISSILHTAHKFSYHKMSQRMKHQHELSTQYQHHHIKLHAVCCSDGKSD